MKPKRPRIFFLKPWREITLAILLTWMLYYLNTHQFPNLLIPGIRLQSVIPKSLVHLPVADDCLKRYSLQPEDEIPSLSSEQIELFEKEFTFLKQWTLRPNYRLAKSRYEQMDDWYECYLGFKPVIQNRSTGQILTGTEITKALSITQVDLPKIAEYFYGPPDHEQFMVDYNRRLEGKICQTEKDRSNCTRIVNPLPEEITDGLITTYPNGTIILHRLVPKYGFHYKQIILYPNHSVTIDSTPLLTFRSSILF